ncbi:MAG: GAF domain-containing protein [Nodosilinea sp.]
MEPPFPEKLNSDAELRARSGLRRVVARIYTTLERDDLVRQVTGDLQQKLGVDRVLLYYFYSQWKGRVTFEVLSDPTFSIFGSTGPDECFNDEYAALYLAGRVRAIADIEVEPIAECHRNFLRDMGVRANLVVPVLIPNGLWGLLVAHHCQAAHPWSEADIAAMQQGAKTLAMSPAVRGDREE